MSYEIVFEDGGHGVVITFAGSVSGKEILAANVEMYGGDKQNLLHYQIWDFSEADSIGMDEESIRDAALQDRQAAADNPDQIIAIIGTEDFFAGIDKRFAIYTEVWSGFSTRTFLVMSEARKWVEFSLVDR